MAASDHEQIRALLARYNFAFDFGDAEAWTACFTDDGAFESVGVESEPVHVDRADLHAFAERQFGINQLRGRHWTNNELIEIDGDGQEATMSCYMLALTVGRGLVGTTGVYRDRLRKVDGQWRFVHRHIAIDPPPST